MLQSQHQATLGLMQAFGSEDAIVIWLATAALRENESEMGGKNGRSYQLEIQSWKLH